MKIIKKFSLVVVLSAITSVSSVGQDTHNFTQFYFNPALLNPSYTGSDGKVAMYASFRKQWAGIDGAPTIGSFSLQTALSSGVNVGLNASNDKNGLLSTSGALLTGGYTLPITPTNFIRFGISVGAAWNKVDLNNLKFASGSDAVQATLLANNMQVLGNLGLSFHSSTFHVGVSAPNIFQPVYLSGESFSVSKVSPFETIIAHASNRFYFAKDKNVFEPYVIYRYHQNAPAQLEAAAVLHLQNAVWLGGSYKQDFGISALAGFKVKGQLAVGYSYSLKNTGANKISSPSHEINLGILFGERHKRIPAYSFVNTEKDKKTAKELAASKKQHDIAKQKALDRQRALDKQKRELIAKKSATAAKKDAALTAKKDPTKVENHTGGPRLKQKEDYLQTTNGNQKDPVKTDPVKTDPIKTDVVKTDPIKTDPIKTDVVKTDPVKTDVVKTDPVKTDPTKTDPIKTNPVNVVATSDKEQHEDEQDKIKRLTDHSADPDEHHGLDNEEHPHAERHEFVKRGNHVDEMEIGDYIIAGVCRAKENAKHFSDGLIKLGFSISDFGYLTEKNLWYVYLGETDDIDMARRERDKYRKMKMFKDCWLLTVHH